MIKLKTISIIPRILISIFFAFFILQLGGLVFLTVVPSVSRADVIFEPQVGIPGQEMGGKDIKAREKIPISPTSIGEYISAIYKYAIGIVGILAAVVMMYGGVLWLTAGGSQQRAGEAKEWIVAALTGLVLALCSYMILYLVNPELVKIGTLDVSKEGGEKDKNGATVGAICSSVSDCSTMTCGKYNQPSCDGGSCSCVYAR